MEKDLVSAISRTSRNFLAVTNHDVRNEQLNADGWRAQLGAEGVHDALLDDSIERKECVSEIWAKRGARLKLKHVVDQMQVRPVLNECTHFSCVMDPAVHGGGLLWVKAYEEPVEMEQDFASSESGMS
ncbi:hypothetical protein C8J57DRAFT_88366 [Mycena rebaudengoi]|nr:hypothetical protein C8J57DRAFT_88366 [Mycena rebaudengoi]